uniref:RNase H type-1 domain-containing protein n=1 Tax=Fagus sylvatica TaxID=28930 RepID=A0A2N9ELJ7_FAGSY
MAVLGSNLISTKLTISWCEISFLRCCGTWVLIRDSLLLSTSVYPWSSQSLSKDKSGIFVSKGVHVQFTRQEKLESRINGWKCKSLSWSGRATLIKYVALATPIYSMSAFKLPKGLRDSINSLVRKFWWNPRKDGIKFATPKAWIDLCKPLLEGGLGFRAFESFNEAMIAKLAWWVLSRRDSFCVQVLKAKYKVGCNWLLKNPSKNASFAWRGIEGARSLLARGACWLVGSGNDILVWRDPWIPNLPNFIPQPRNPNQDMQFLVVAQLMKKDKSGWNEKQLHLLFDDATVSTIKNISRWCVGQEDNGFERVLLSGALIMDLIWKGRNAKLHEGKDASMEENRPRQGCIKFNLDAAIAEAEALLWATQLAGDLEVEMTCFESDSRSAIEAVF